MYSYFVAAMTDEALGMVKAVVSGYGIEAWAELHKKYNQRTMTRMMRVLMECMYPKEIKGGGVGGGNIAMGRKVEEDDGRTAERNKYSRAVADGGVDEDVSRKIERMIVFRWDAMGEKYIVIRDKVMTWAVNKADEMGGPVPMDVGGVMDEWEGEGWGEEGEEDEVGAGYPNTRCYHCQGYGHMARECPQKGKGKGDMKGGGKGVTKGEFKWYGKGGGTKGGFKGDGIGSGLRGFEKGYWPNGGEKGGG
jgi:hypothetical protein